LNRSYYINIFLSIRYINYLMMMRRRRRSRRSRRRRTI